MIGDTLSNLNAAWAGEHFEHTELYPEFARVASEEGFEVIAQVFRSISVAERQHEKRYRELAANVEKGRVFDRDKPVVWRCLNCGLSAMKVPRHPQRAPPVPTRSHTSNCLERIGKICPAPPIDGFEAAPFARCWYWRLRMPPVEIMKDIFWVGAIDWNVRDFHGYSTPKGTT